MIGTYRGLLELLDTRERRQFWLLLVMFVGMGFADMLGVAAVLPLFAVLANPEAVRTNPYLSAAYDILGFANGQSFLLFLGAVTFVFVAVGQAYKALTMYALTRFSSMREMAIGRRLLTGYLGQPYEWFLDRHSAELTKSVLSEVAQAVHGALVPGLRMLAQGAVLIFLTGLLIALHPMAAIASSAVVLGAYAAIFMACRRYLDRIGADRVRANEERFRVVDEAVGAIKEMKALGLEQAYVSRFDDPSARFARRQAASTVVSELPRYLLEAVGMGGMLLLLLVLLATTDSRLDSVLPIVSVYAFAGARMFPAVQQLYAGFTALRFSRPAVDALVADLRLNAHPSAAVDRKSEGVPLGRRCRIEIENVQYAYPGAARPALWNLSLAIEPATIVGFVGPTGAGKTTIIDLILGLLTPQAGRLMVDGTVVDRSSVRVWQRSLGYVPQQIFLADDTVAANIAFGVPSDQIDMASVERAASLACLDRFITGELPLGYNTRVGERGIRLSGGQRQRIGLARALYRKPAVLILDEATSALDAVTERAVLDGLRSLEWETTIIMIAHRLSTVAHCDEIFVIERGRCVASGSYGNLLATSSVFREIASASLRGDESGHPSRSFGLGAPS
jgi:ABC-type multidrug transport system fused ATPase/permease subunit